MQPMKVLLALDGFQPSLEAMALLRRIGDVRKVRITVASVTPTGMLAPEHLPLALDPVEARRESSVEIVDSRVSQLLADGFEASGAVLEGSPSRELASFINEEWFDVSIVGSGRRTWLGSALLGSTSSYLIHNSPSSVLVAHRAPRDSETAQILVATDGSRGSEFGLSALSGLADRERVQITAISVAAGADLLVGDNAASTGQYRVNSNDDVPFERAQRQAHRAAQKLADAGFGASSRGLVGSPSEAILKEIENTNADLVVVGSRGEGPLRRALMGSVSDTVVRHAPATLVGRRHPC
jgi:nucleotide-binding universal stress UspA family protein